MDEIYSQLMNAFANKALESYDFQKLLKILFSVVLMSFSSRHLKQAWFPKLVRGLV